MPERSGIRARRPVPRVDADPEVVELRARVARQVDAIEELRSEVSWLTRELIARDADGAAPVDSVELGADGAPPEWRPMLHAIRRLVHEHVPHGSRLVVVSSGVDALLRYAGYRAEHFSQDRLGAYVGSHPSCSRVATVQLEAARWRGADVLLIPQSELWWLDHYPEFGRHIDQRYARVAHDESAGVIWDLRKPSPLREVHDVLSSLCVGLDHRPALLDWYTGQDLAGYFDEYKVFSPLGEGRALPYLDDTIDVVALGEANADRVAEAFRVASSFVIQIAPGPMPSINVLWQADQVEAGSGDVSIVVASDGRPSVPGFAERLLDSVPVGFAGEIVIDEACVTARPARRTGVKIVECPDGEQLGARLRRCARAASGDVLVLLDGATWPTSGWLRPLVRLLHDVEDAGFVTGMLVEADGRLIAAGSDAASGLADVVSDDRLDAARHTVVRRLEAANARFFATQRRLFLEWDRTADVDDHVATAFGSFVRARGQTLLYEPETVAISSWSELVPAYAETPNG